MNKSHGRWAHLIFGAFWLLGMGWPGSRILAPNEPAVVRPDPLVFEVGLGEVKTLNILLENANSVYGIELYGQFDAQAVEVVDANPGKNLVQMAPGTIPKPDFVVRNLANNTTGTFEYATTQLSPTLPMSGNGVVVSIQVRGKRLGESTFTISPVIVADIDGTTLPVTIQNGMIEVIPAVDGFLLYLPVLRK
jgi:hypothetical protein